ncbi:MAG TPA: DUF4878 domain-containing protein [Blastocatellia bacterium]|nr:DUF4878 domain-containing protein [Blastocatellia bacterium]
MRNGSRLTVLCFLTMFILNCGGSRPSDTVKKYFESADKGDLDGTMKLVSARRTAASSDLTIAKGEIMVLIGTLRDEGGVKSLEIAKEKVDGDSAQVDVKLYVNKGPTEDLSYRLVKEAGAWKMEDMVLAPLK